jgi:hypothetical protein
MSGTEPRRGAARAMAATDKLKAEHPTGIPWPRQWSPYDNDDERDGDDAA